LVKPLHLLGSIASRISQGNGHRVRLKYARRDFSAQDPSAAVMSALASPLDYPPLAESVVPGDRVAIAVDAAVPQVVDVVRGAVEALASSGVDRDAMVIVAASSELAAACRGEFAGNGAGGVQVVLHDPDDEKNLCFVGLSRRREPVVVNRAIFDADLVLSIGCARLHGGAYDAIYPRFSATSAIERRREPSAIDSPNASKTGQRESLDAGRLIGVGIGIQVVPGQGDSVAHAVAGEPESVAKTANRLHRRQWSQRSSRRVSLVIATVTGGPLAQTWNSVADALVAAERLTDDDGAVAICTNLDRPLGESLGQLIGQSNAERVGRKVYHDRAEDSWAAWQLVRALARGPVYLLSQLDADVVEEIGVAPVQDIDELVRLAGRHESCIVLDDAQHAIAVVEGEQ
jgi:nickel-dependent lactate racemase